jgi:DNA-binding NtrC family response regulator
MLVRLSVVVDSESLANPLPNSSPSIDAVVQLQPIEGDSLAELPTVVVSEQSSRGLARSNNGEAPQRQWLPEDWKELPWTQLRGILMSACEDEYIRYHLEETQGRIGKVAKRTGLSNRAVSLMMKRQGVSKEGYRRRAES